MKQKQYKLHYSSSRSYPLKKEKKWAFYKHNNKMFLCSTISRDGRKERGTQTVSNNWNMINSKLWDQLNERRDKYSNKFY